MSDGTETEKPMSTEAATEPAEKADGQQQEQTFTQAEVDRIVKQRADRIAKERYADYDDLKAKAEDAKTLEQKFADLKSELDSTRADALRARVAADHGVSTKKGPNGEPSDADLFLTGSDEATLTAQAQRLAARETDRKKNGNTAPKEGAPVTTDKGDASTREFVRGLFGNPD